MDERTLQNSLRNLKDPQTGKELLESGMIRDLKLEGKTVSLRLVLPTPAHPARKKIEEDIRLALHSLGGIRDIQLQVDAEVKKASSLENFPRLKGIKNIIAVASGKGGVGKSTVAANLAVALQQLGAKVGILDADIYGPSVPTLFGIKERQPAVDPEKQKLIPLERYHLKIMSIGFMMKETDAVIWRGPMIHKLLQQFLEDVDWGDLDYLIVDLPPGTGDAQLSLSQLIPITGGVIVTTPQDVALADVTRGVTMFGKVGIPVLGVVENMSYFQCPHCAKRTEIFSHGGGKRKAEEMKTEFLGEVPLDPQTREGSDLGKPITAEAPQSPQAKRFLEIAQKVAGLLASHEEKAVKIQL